MKAVQVIKAMVLVSTAGLMMGNQSCQKTAVTPARAYKKIVEMGSIDAQPITLPDGTSFDFKFVANEQMYGVIAANGNFSLRGNSLVVSDPSLSSSSSLKDSQAFNLSTADKAMLQKSFDVTQSDFRAAFSRTAWCMVNLPQARLYGSVNSFEIIGGAGLSLGYTPTGPAAITGIGANFSVQSAQLDISMRGLPPLGSTILGATNVTAKQTKTSVGLTLNLGLFSVGPSAYYSTPLATVVQNGLTTGLNQLSTAMASDTWYTRVFADEDTSVVLVGGNDVGFEVGDQLDIYNEQYAWDGEACNSNYLGGVGTGEDSYYARVEITSVGDQLSQAKVVTIDPNATQGFASVGAKVKLYKLKEDLATTPTTTTTTSSSSLASNTASK